MSNTTKPTAKYSKPDQKLISFTDDQNELAEVEKDISNGWNLISLIKNGSYYVGIMESCKDQKLEPGTIFVPPRKRIKISR